MTESTGRERHRVIAPTIFAEPAGGVAGALSPYRITDVASQIGQLWMLGDELYEVLDIDWRKDAGPIPAHLPIMVRVKPANGWLAVREVGRPLPVRWERETGGELPVFFCGPGPAL